MRKIVFFDTKPYVLLNFEGKYDDVSTLAHELGHSMHTYYSCKNNTYNNSSYNIFVAEVASTVNELLLANYLLKNSNNVIPYTPLLKNSGYHGPPLCFDFHNAL